MVKHMTKEEDAAAAAEDALNTSSEKDAGVYMSMIVGVYMSMIVTLMCVCVCVCVCVWVCVCERDLFCSNIHLFVSIPQKLPRNPQTVRRRRKTKRKTKEIRPKRR